MDEEKELALKVYPGCKQRRPLTPEEALEEELEIKELSYHHTQSPMHSHQLRVLSTALTIWMVRQPEHLVYTGFPNITLAIHPEYEDIWIEPDYSIFKGIREEKILYEQYFHIKKQKAVPEAVIEVSGLIPTEQNYRSKLLIYQQFRIPEYIVIDLLGMEIIRFSLNSTGYYYRHKPASYSINNRLNGLRFQFVGDMVRLFDDQGMIPTNREMSMVQKDYGTIFGERQKPKLKIDDEENINAPSIILQGVPATKGKEPVPLRVVPIRKKEKSDKKQIVRGKKHLRLVFEKDESIARPNNTEANLDSNLLKNPNEKSTNDHD